MIENPILRGFKPDPSILRVDGQRDRAAFTGCFVGMCCQDLANNNHHADFKWFDYKEFER